MDDLDAQADLLVEVLVREAATPGFYHLAVAVRQAQAQRSKGKEELAAARERHQQAMAGFHAEFTDPLFLRSLGIAP